MEVSTPPIPYVDFVELKARVGIEQVAAMLSLDMQRSGAQLRAPCPACKAGGDRALVVSPAKQAFHCFGGRAGGDLIALVALRGFRASPASVTLMVARELRRDVEKRDAPYNID